MVIISTIVIEPMNSLMAISLWFALVTVVPGLITIAAVVGGVVYIDAELFQIFDVQLNEWIWGALTVTIMILTQAMGIILEGFLVRRKMLGESTISVEKVRLGIGSETQEVLKPYHEYEHLYPLLVLLEEGDDPYGHLERAITQFFLTVNTLVSFGAGIVTVIGIMLFSTGLHGLNTGVALRSALYGSILLFAMLISYRVAIIRFQVMAVSAWSLRNKDRMTLSR